MDALGLLSSGIFSGYTIIWAGGAYIQMGKSFSAANGSFLIVTTAIGGQSFDVVMSGFMIIANGKSAYFGGFGYDAGPSSGVSTSTVGIIYSGSTIKCTDNDSVRFSGFIIS